MKEEKSKSIIPVDEVEYLVFSGGGGKAVVHLGAIQALEGLLKNWKGKGEKCLANAKNMRGFAGSSSGALIAMMLAMESTFKDIELNINRFFGNAEGIPRVLGDRFFKTTPQAPRYPVEGFFSGEVGRKILLNRRFIIDGSPTSIEPQKEEIKQTKSILEMIEKDLYLRESLINYRSTVNKIYFAEIFTGLAGREDFLLELGAEKIFEQFEKRVKGTKFEIFVRDRQDFNLYYFNFLFHEGMLPGYNLFGAVFWCARQSRLYVRKKFDPITLTFQQLYNLTGIELIVTGTKLGKRWASAYFSKDETPDFPVVPAVALSMTYPFLFKPVYLSCLPTTESCENMPSEYVGKWIDGGLLNNLPLHAFDRAPDQALNYKVVAFNLTEPPDFRSSVTVPEIVESNIDQILTPLLAQSSEGQIRDDIEALQVVNLGTGNLSTLDVAANSQTEEAKRLIGEALTTTQEYFTPTSRCFPVADRWEKKAPKSVNPTRFQELARTQIRAAYQFVSPVPVTIRPYTDKGGKKIAKFYFSVDIVAVNAPNFEEALLGTFGFVLYEVKSSESARLSKNQRLGIPLVAQFGGHISSELDETDYPDEAPYFLSGAKILPQAVRILRPGNLCNEFTLAKKLKGSLKELGRKENKQIPKWRGDDYPQLK